jgi:hypothetical protein
MNLRLQKFQQKTFHSDRLRILLDDCTNCIKKQGNYAEK